MCPILGNVLLQAWGVIFNLSVLLFFLAVLGATSPPYDPVKLSITWRLMYGLGLIPIAYMLFHRIFYLRESSVWQVPCLHACLFPHWLVRWWSLCFTNCKRKSMLHLAMDKWQRSCVEKQISFCLGSSASGKLFPERLFEAGGVGHQKLGLASGQCYRRSPASGPSCDNTRQWMHHGGGNFGSRLSFIGCMQSAQERAEYSPACHLARSRLLVTFLQHSCSDHTSFHALGACCCAEICRDTKHGGRRSKEQTQALWSGQAQAAATALLASPAWNSHWLGGELPPFISTTSM